mgnify:FL=1
MTKPNSFYTSDDLNIFKHAVNWKKYFSKKMSKYIEGDVLEVGPGLGSNTLYLLENTENIINSWTFVEPETNFINSLNKLSKSMNYKSKIYNSTIDKISGCYDTILYIDVLEHISNTNKELEQIKLKLNPGGVLIVLVPCYNFLYSPFDKSVGHIKRYNKKILKKEVDLEITKLFYLDTFGLLASIANKFILKKSMPNKGNILFWDRFLVRASIILDRFVFFKFGKSLIGIFKN